jgi:hypothetical protein
MGLHIFKMQSAYRHDVLRRPQHQSTSQGVALNRSEPSTTKRQDTGHRAQGTACMQICTIHSFHEIRLILVALCQSSLCHLGPYPSQSQSWRQAGSCPLPLRRRVPATQLSTAGSGTAAASNGSTLQRDSASSRPKMSRWGTFSAIK